MNKEDFTSKIQDIRTNLSDEAKVGTLLTELFDGFDTIYNDKEKISNTVSELEKSNELLRKANMDLFLKIGEKKEPEEIIDDLNKEKEIKKRSFDELFKEGGIK